MDETKKPTIRSTKKKVLITDEGVDGQLISDNTVSYDTTLSTWRGAGGEVEIPDMLAYIQSKTELTRTPILEILKKSKRLNELFLNPQLFMDNAVLKIKEELHQLMIDGIMYEKIGDKIYFVAETKSAGQELRGSEKLKIDCGAAHFKNFEDVVYKRVSSVTDLNK